MWKRSQFSCFSSDLGLIEENTVQSNLNLALTQRMETGARTISAQVFPVFRSLHSLDLAIARHIAEFELFVLDNEQGTGSIQATLSKVRESFAEVPAPGAGSPVREHIVPDLDRACRRRSDRIRIFEHERSLFSYVQGAIHP